MDANKNTIEVQAEVGARKHWEAPRIVLERSLEVSAQGGPPVAPNGFIGPMAISGGICGTDQ